MRTTTTTTRTNGVVSSSFTDENGLTVTLSQNQRRPIRVETLEIKNDLGEIIASVVVDDNWTMDYLSGLLDTQFEETEGNGGSEMKILFIDDERSVHHQIENVTTARTSVEAIAFLEASLSGQTYDEVWLDHDLGGDDTITPVVDWLAEQAFHNVPYPATIVIHTANPVGQRMIARAMKRYGYKHEILPATSWV